MSQSKVHTYRRMLKGNMRKEYRKYIYDYVDGLCREPLKVRLSFLFLILRKRNPHTGKKVKR